MHTNGETALHLATSTGNIKLVQNLVSFMSEEDLEMVNRYGSTALHLAAVIGATRIVKLLINKNKMFDKGDFAAELLALSFYVKMFGTIE
ncbi:hypothetical protein GH714_034152 [Hevea brasiliensis]|uniref:Uncharacterized protein n=1 Tax=Hevea brasiliensis TaxID=3981 RepID=A0A6A6L6V4_HEVBR|nr:hypothetical protein GH714_034152 [Hevea brasiliensis]